MPAEGSKVERVWRGLKLLFTDTDHPEVEDREGRVLRRLRDQRREARRLIRECERACSNGRVGQR